jgi:toxin-antitoxin system PIN domain toxin
MTHLLDSTVLVARAVEDHVHHSAAARWWTASGEPFATCPVTQGALLRLLLRERVESEQAARALHLLTGHPHHIFWPGAIGYDAVKLTRVLGPGQVTDAYLVGLTRHPGARLATFDRDLAQEAADVATLVALA